jgi:drug/metabolite transporter (DMT)-like permease
MQALLFTTVSLAWGLTWYAIHLQLGPTPDSVSIFWRFATATGLIWAGLWATGRLRRPSLRQHSWFAVLGLTLFSCNFLCLYGAEHYIPSGLVSVVFSMATVFNALNQWGFRGIRPSRRVLVGALLGIGGVGLLFSEQLGAVGHYHYLRGVLLALGGSYLFSLGNLASGQATASGTTLPNAVARGMSWGTALLGLAILGSGESFRPALTLPYLGGLAYLSLIGTVVGFLAYLSLVARAGPARAAYTTVVSPVVALAVSSVLEGYGWTLPAAFGVLLILCGNLIIFARRPGRMMVFMSAVLRPRG